jgi:hypothetical protein
MGLDDQRTASGQGRGCVATGHRKRKGEIAGRKHGHRPQGHAHARHGRVTTGRRARHGRVVQHRKRRAPLGHVGKALQLKSRAVQLAVQPHRPQGGLVICQGHQGLAVCQQRVGHGPQQGGTHGAVAGRPRHKSISRRVHGSVNLCRG